MADENAVLMYKGHPLMRKDNLIYYGSMADSHIVMLQMEIDGLGLSIQNVHNTCKTSYTLIHQDIDRVNKLSYAHLLYRKVLF